MSNILRRADQIVNHRSEEKERQYGPFAECMDRATKIYNEMSPKDEQISSLGLYRALIALKLSREAYAHKEDNLLDAVAYIGAMNHCLERSWPKFSESAPQDNTAVEIEAEIAEIFERTGLANYARINALSAQEDKTVARMLQETMLLLAKNFTLKK